MEPSSTTTSTSNWAKLGCPQLQRDWDLGTAHPWLPQRRTGCSHRFLLFIFWEGISCVSVPEGAESLQNLSRFCRVYTTLLARRNIIPSVSATWHPSPCLVSFSVLHVIPGRFCVVRCCRLGTRLGPVLATGNLAQMARFLLFPLENNCHEEKGDTSRDIA